MPMIKQPELLALLRRLLSRSPFMSDWRKLSNGRLVRFIDWRKAVRHA